VFKEFKEFAIRGNVIDMARTGSFSSPAASLRRRLDAGLAA
jgi:hypothetical protein